jgi:hypothetical protein
MTTPAAGQPLPKGEGRRRRLISARSLGERADEFAPRGIGGVARYVSQELPVVFAAALRSRIM